MKFTYVELDELSLLQNKLLSLFHIKAYSLNNIFDDFQHFLSCTKKCLDIIAVNETRIVRQISLLNNLSLNNYSSECTSTETSVDGILL